MVVVGAATALGLYLLGLPFALSLGLLAALLDFVPNFGPLISALPALLLALLQGPWQVLYVALLYVGINLLDGYLLTPLVQRRTVSLSPALLLFAQLLMGVLAGALGVLVATPLSAVTLLLVKRLYIEERLEENSSQSRTTGA